MCGLAGFIDTSGEKDNQRLAAIVSQMAETLRHRGPDDDATWTDAQAGIALGFRRLAILDLTESGRQPMHSRCERFVIVFNGEIYNHGELRQQLEMEGHPFRGRSDTEVILAAVSQWGVQRALQNFQWHVCLRTVGPPGAPIASCAGSPRGEAVVLRLDGNILSVRLRTEKSERLSWFSSNYQSFGSGTLFPPQLCASAAFHIRRHLQTAARNGSDSRLFEKQSDSVFLAILDPQGSSHEWPSKPICWLRERCRRRVRKTSSSIGAIENDCRRPAWSLPLRRCGLFGRGGANAIAELSTDSNVLPGQLLR